MDSDNILSILASLGSGQQPQAAPSNFLQQAAPPSLPAYSPPPAAPVQAPQATPTAEAPRPRRSLLDTLGRISDVIAKVGGADALYQPTLDAREDRTLALGDHARQVDLDALKKTLTEQQVTAGALEPQIAERKRIGTALGALVGHEQDAAALWPHIAEQAGLDPQRAAALGQMIANNPASVGILAKSLGADTDNLGKNVFFGTTSAGKTVAYQVGPDGHPHVLDFGAGVTPSEPIKVVNTGGSNVIVGQGGNVKSVLPNTPAPGTVLTAKTNKEIATGHDATQIKIAGMPARPTAAAAGKGPDPAMIETAQGNLDELKSIYNDLHKMGAMVSPAQAKDKNVIARIRASGLGQTLEGAVGTEAQRKRDRINSIRPGLMQSLAKATGMTGKQLDSNADVKLFMQTVTDPTKAYESNMDAIAGLERFLKANAKKAAATPVTPVARPKAKDGWTLVEVK